MPLRSVLRSVEPSLRLERLPPGPQRLPPGQVASHQRTRLHLAMIDAVADRGYAATTVRQLTKLAGVSTRTFYEHYAGKHDCFLATYELVVHRTALHVMLAPRTARNREDGLRLAFRAFAADVAREPKAARFALVEALGAGPAAFERVHRARDLYAHMITMSFSRAPGDPVLHPLIAIGIASGVAEVMRASLLAGGIDEPVRIADELADWTWSYRSTLAPSVQSPARAQTPLWPTSSSGDDLGLVRGGPACEQGLGAALRLAAERGVLQLTPAAIANDAGISVRRFRELHEDCSSCVLDAIASGWAEAVDGAVRAAGLLGGWANRLYRALSELLARFAADPAFADVAFVQVFALGRPGLRCRDALLRDAAEALRRRAPKALRPSKLVADATVAAVWSVIQWQVARGSVERLSELEAPLAYILLTPLIGAEGAARTILGERMTKADACRSRRRPAPLTLRV